MRTYILKRLVQIVPTVLMITFVVFVMMRSVPGDPVVSVLGDAYTEEDAIKARAAYALAKPIGGQGGVGRPAPRGAAGPPGGDAPPAGAPRADRPVDVRGPGDRGTRRDHRGAAAEHLGRLHRDDRGHDRGFHSGVLYRGAAPAG